MSPLHRSAHASPTTAVTVLRYDASELSQLSDVVATEEPLEIAVSYVRADGIRVSRVVSVTMRTPGHDYELAVGFLRGEGLLAGLHDLEDPEPGLTAGPNRIEVRLRPGVEFELGALERHFYTTSSCGVCGKASIEALQIGQGSSCADQEFVIAPALAADLPRRLRAHQSAFDQTGGLHAAGLFDASGEALVVREDVGRHNAVDKVLGRWLLDGRGGQGGGVLVLSGRASFELVQKAQRSGVACVVAVGAPSSLAVEAARASGITLLGFARPGRVNVYAGAHRLAPEVFQGVAR